jgi:hypothetical protein
MPVHAMPMACDADGVLHQSRVLPITRALPIASSTNCGCCRSRVLLIATGACRELRLIGMGTDGRLELRPAPIASAADRAWDQIATGADRMRPIASAADLIFCQGLTTFGSDVARNT